MFQNIMDNILFYLIIFIVLDLIILFFIFFKKKKLSNSQKQRFLQIYQDIQSHPLEKQILEYDKLLEKVLHARGYKESLGNILKSHPSLFTNLDSLWKAHKLRNNIAHELEYTISPSEGEKSVKAFQSNIHTFIDL